MHASLLIYETAEGFDARHDPATRDDYWRGTLQYLADLKAAGIFLGGAGLMPPSSARHLRREGDLPLIEDGPYADTKEQLGGLFMIEVPDLDAALAWAARFPARPGLVVEVRPHLPAD